jgi:hypothetical protein
MRRQNIRIEMCGSIAVAVVLLAGCQGVILDGPVSPEGGRSRNPPDGPSCMPDELPLRRLSRAEYMHSVRDLFSGITLPTLGSINDPRVAGFTNNAAQLAPSALLITQYNENAVAISRAARDALLDDLDCTGDEGNCFRSFVEELGGRIFRRPLSAEELDTFAGIYATVDSDLGLAIEIGVQAMLQSPQFLYRPELGSSSGTLSDYEVATRLSYLMWSTTPDDALLAAAAAGELTQPSTLGDQVERMLDDPRAREGILHFFGEWLEFDALGRFGKRAEDGYDAAMQASMRESSERFLWERVFDSDRSLEQLFTSAEVPVDERVAPLFGYDQPVEGWQWIELDPSERAGFLTQPTFLASHGYENYPSPVLRGVFMRDRILCDPPLPPPGGVDTTPPEYDPSMPQTNRMRYEQATTLQGGPCTTCHTQINPYGYAFESFDTMGRYQTEDRGLPIDTSGNVAEFEFDDATELSAALVDNDRVHSCVAERWLVYASGGGPLADDPCLRSELVDVLETSGSLRELVVALALHPKFAQAHVEAP